MNTFTVKYFMWPFQPHFQASAHSAADRLFSQLQPELDAKVFLVGFRQDNGEDRCKVCVEPDHNSIGPSCFDNIDRTNHKCIQEHPQSHRFYSHPDAARSVHDRIVAESCAKAIELHCARVDGERIFFASQSVLVDRHDVSCVLSLSREHCQQHVFDLPHQGLGPMGALSLIEVIAREFSDSCRNGLREPDPGRSACATSMGTEELLRRAGRTLMKRIGERLIGLEDLGQALSLYSNIEKVSGMRYEGSVPQGVFVFVTSSELEQMDCIKFQEAIPLDASKRVRKMMELTASHGDLVVSPKGLAGLTQSRRANGISVRVLSFRRWRLSLDTTTICDFEEGTPVLPKSRISKADFLEVCWRTFDSGMDSEALWEAAEACIHQSHGTTLVISSDAKSEIARLSRQSTPIEPQHLIAKEIEAVTSIDGAILLDTDGVCHGIGVILDGLASEAGDPGRGARFNSAIRYLNSGRGNCVILIVSEDGDITILPKLRPRVRRSVVENAVNALTCSVQEVPLRRRVYAEALNAVERLRFYLSEEQCRMANDAVATAEAKMHREEETVLFPSDKFVPNPRMDESHFLPHAATVQ